MHSALDARVVVGVLENQLRSLLLLRESAGVVSRLNLLEGADAAGLRLLVLEVLEEVGVARGLRVLLYDLVREEL